MYNVLPKVVQHFPKRDPVVTLFFGPAETREPDKVHECVVHLVGGSQSSNQEYARAILIVRLST